MAFAYDVGFVVKLAQVWNPLSLTSSFDLIGELKQPRRRRQQKPHKFTYLTIKNSVFARFARAFFIFWHFEDLLVLSTTWKDLFCSCVDDGSIWWQMLSFVLCPNCWFQFNSRIVRTHFSSIMSLNNWKVVAETRSHMFRWRSRFRRRRVCLSSLLLREATLWGRAGCDNRLIHSPPRVSSSRNKSSAEISQSEILKCPHLVGKYRNFIVGRPFFNEALVVWFYVHQ